MKLLNHISPLYCRISYSWLILAFVIFVTSCSTPSSVRTGNVYQNKSKKNLNTNAKKITITDTTEEEKIFSPKVVPDKKNMAMESNPEPVKRMPTIREKMNAYDEQQAKNTNELAMINKRLDENEKSINDINSSIDNIKTAIIQLKNEKAKTGAGETVKVETTQEIKKNVDIKPQKSVILSDEEYEKSQNIKIEKKAENPVKPVKKNVIKNPVKKKTNSNTKNETIEKKEKKEKDVKADSHYTSDDLSSAIGEIQNRNYGSALSGLQKAEAKTKDANAISEINYYYGEAYSGMKNYQKAVQYFQKVAKSKSSKQAKAQAKLAEILLKSGQTAEAKEAYEKLIEKHPKSEFAPIAKKMLQQL